MDTARSHRHYASKSCAISNVKSAPITLVVILLHLKIIRIYYKRTLKARNIFFSAAAPNFVFFLFKFSNHKTVCTGAFVFVSCSLLKSFLLSFKSFAEIYTRKFRTHQNTIFHWSFFYWLFSRRAE